MEGVEKDRLDLLSVCVYVAWEVMKWRRQWILAVLIQRDKIRGKGTVKTGVLIFRARVTVAAKGEGDFGTFDGCHLPTLELRPFSSLLAIKVEADPTI